MVIYVAMFFLLYTKNKLIEISYKDNYPKYVLVMDESFFFV